ncbi:structural maintenance of chromosome protein [Cavenderia fasciculata]|uniref:Structural maintenance of chromosome protein n=1 Tax=Cavenderia fasciculata TaxID=261658 RepID=F4QEP3_CACFS|nr:structural maintenance of chromosome protein [Cavenderia fasciculata]EGG13304.1 structural maintenance of chromosome protein [Cavenderia fasciculata]|eukprot:XP_004350003.1 structural maintenance of chromosome protein [Cavenderia fasciculata]
MVGKRKEVEEESDDDEIIVSQDIKRIKTQQQQQQQQQRRIVQQEEDSDEEFEDSQPQSSSTTARATKAVHNGNGHSTNGNGHRTKSVDSSESEDEEMDEDEDGVAGESELGIIESISVENFMCHRHFEIKFGPNVNFISGENGSGKSALLVALIICLGAKSGTTNRGHKLADLVKNDANQAIITVKLRNKGPEAHLPEEFGPSIIIERKISRSGGGGYKLKDHTGKKVISTKFSDLAVILELFNIQIENPMAILMQDTSREFLNTSRPQDKYNLFLTATQLDQMKKDYLFINDQIKGSEQELDKKGIIIKEMEKKVEALSKEFKDLQAVVDLEQKVQHLKEQLAWSYVFGVEQTIVKKKAALAQIIQEKNNIQNETQGIGQQINAITNDMADKRKKIEELSSEISKKQEEKQQVEVQLLEVAKEESRFVARSDDKRKRMNHLKQRRENQHRSIQEIKRKNEAQRRNQSKQSDVDRKRQQLEELEKKSTIITQEISEIKTEGQKLQSIRQEKQMAVSNVQNQVSKLEKQLIQLKSALTDNLRIYGDRFPTLVKKIQDNSRKFSVQPIGPLGTMIKINDERWSYAIESIIKRGLLGSFLVGSYKDGNLLFEMAKSVGIHNLDYTVVKMNNVEPYKTAEHDRLDPSYHTVLRAIQCDNVIVRNYLIDTRGLETYVLVNNVEEGKNIIYGQKPHIIREAYTPIADRIFGSRDSQKLTTGDSSGRSQILRASVEQLVRELDGQIKGYRPQIDQCEREERDAAQKDSAFQQAFKQKDQEYQRLTRELYRVKTDLKTLEEQLVEPTDEPTDELEQGMETINKEMEEIQQELQSIEHDRQKFDDSKRPFVEQMRQIDHEADKIQRIVGKLDNEIKNLSRSERDLRMKEGKVISNVGEYDKKKLHLEDELTNDQLLHQESMQKAQEFCDRVEVAANENPSTLSQKIQKTEELIRKESKGKRSRAEVHVHFKECRDKLVEILRTRDEMTKFNNKLKIHLNFRQKNWVKFQRKISLRVSQYFNIFLSRKGYSGKIDFDHEDKKLEVSVQLDKMRPSENVTGKGDTKSLSGGERSFSTVALLLSLWEAMECPFRAMDEFDVFMDEVNRRISIELLLSKARQTPTRQFIFVTPLSLNSITPSPFIYIHRVRPPQRGQRTITETLNS